MIRDRRLFRSRNRSSPSSVSSSSSPASLKFARLFSDDNETKPEECSSFLLVSSSPQPTTTNMMEEAFKVDNKENSSYDFRSIESTKDDDDDDDASLFQHITERNDLIMPSDDNHFSPTTTSTSFVTLPPDSSSTPVAASDQENHGANDLNMDIAQALALVGLLLDSYPKLREPYLARYNMMSTNDSINSMNRAFESAPATSSASQPPLQVWLLVVAMIVAVLALDGLVTRLTDFFSADMAFK
jgi:hypothetical protein